MSDPLQKAALLAVTRDALLDYMRPYIHENENPVLQIHCPKCPIVYQYQNVDDIPLESVICPCGGRVLVYENINYPP